MQKKAVGVRFGQVSLPRSPGAKAAFAAASQTLVSGFPGSLGARQYGQLRVSGRLVACAE